jgi:AcrR family transcriptional regulator
MVSGAAGSSTGSVNLGVLRSSSGGWGTVARLSRELIVQEALALVDEAGLDALTARRLAQRVGARSASLFYHIADMEDLLTEVAWQVVLPTAQVVVEGDSWQAVALARARVFRTAVLAHPNIIPVLAGPLGRRVLSNRLYHGVSAELEQFLAMLAADGITDEDALTVIEAIEAFSIGAATVGSPHLAMSAENGVGDQLVGPRLSRILNQHDGDPDRRFEAGMTALLDGLAQQFAGKRASRRRNTSQRTPA